MGGRFGRATGIGGAARAGVLAAALVIASLAPSAGAFAAVTIAAVQPGYAAARAGLEAGDVVDGWRAADAPGPATRPIASPWDLLALERDAAARGAVTLHGRRDGAPREWRIDDGTWGVTPTTDDDEASWRAYAAIRASADARRFDEVDARWAAWRAAQSDAPSRVALAAIVLAEAMRDLAQPARQLASADDALATIDAAPDTPPMYRALALHGRASALRSLGRLDEAQASAERAADATSRLAAGRSRDIDARENLAMVVRYRDRLDEAGTRLRDVLVARERSEPDGMALAGTLNNVALVQRARGDLDAAERLLRRAVALRERDAPDSLTLAAALNNLGLVTWDRGDLAAAEAMHRRALAIKRRIAPGSMDEGASLENLAYVALDRGDIAAARRYAEQSFAISRRWTPGARQEALSETVLATIAMREGDLDASDAANRRALAIWARVAPDSLWSAWNWSNLGTNASRRGDFERAIGLQQRAFEIRHRLAPGGLDEATSRQNLAVSMLRLRRHDDAAREFRAAAAIRRRLAPESLRHAQSVNGVGVALREGGDAAAARKWLCDATAIIETVRPRFGDRDEDRLGFAAATAEMYRDCAQAQIGAGAVADAFATIERSRARALLALVAERDLRFAPDLPAALAARRADAEARLAEARANARRPATAPADADAPVDVATRALAQVIAEIRRASPRYAALRYPRTLDVAGAAQALDPGVVLVTFVVGTARTDAIVVRAGDPVPMHYAIARPREALAADVAAFRRAIIAGDDAAADALASSLYATLLAPARDAIASASVLLIAPDAELNRLPFAALRDVGGRYLAQSRPSVIVASASAFAQARAARATRAAIEPTRLLAVGDPVYRDAAMPPLPASRTEIESLHALFRGSALLAGANATESAVRARAPTARWLHFAVHARFDDTVPLDSALMLSAGAEGGADARDDGALHTWEIFDGLRVDADLVTLSACETAEGRDVESEGLYGMTRAFQYAGARTVLASLWRVPDVPTARLMTAFYGGLRESGDTAGAFARAQVAAITAGPHSRDESATTRAIRPFAPSTPASTSGRLREWAGFQLYGDWR